MIGPIIKVPNTVVILVSTTRGRKNHFTRLLEMSSELPGYVVRHQVTMVCDDCKHSAAASESCTHMDHLLPEWNDKGRMPAAKLFSSDAMFRQENRGEIVSDHKEVFPTAQIELLAKLRPTDVGDSEGRQIITFIDPAGGGKAGVSDNALVSIVRDQSEPIIFEDQERCVYERTIIVGLAAFRTQNPVEICEMIQDYFANLQDAYPQASHVIMVERNFGGWMVTQIVDWIKQVARPDTSFSEYKDGGGAAGLWTTNTLKAAGVTTMAILLNMEMITFARDLVSQYRDRKQTENLRQAFLEQCRNLRREGTTYTAKQSKGKVGDDMLICFLMALVNSNRILCELDEAGEVERPQVMSSMDGRSSLKRRREADQ